MQNLYMLLGQTGEILAAEYLKRTGWLILGHNLWEKFGELDLLARDTEGTLVLIEVKTMVLMEDGLLPEDNLTKSKLKKFTRIATMFVNKHPKLLNGKGWRMDLLTVSILTDNKKDFVIKHYKNIAPD